MDILVDKERMNSIIEFWQKKCAAAEKELGCSINLRKQIQNDLLNSDRLNDNLEAKNTELKAENERLKSCLQEIKAIGIDSLEFKYESPYLQSIMTVNKERFNILILREDKERWIKAFNGTKEQTNEK